MKTLNDSQTFLNAVLDSLQRDLMEVSFTSRGEVDIRDAMASVFASYASKLAVTPKPKAIGFIRRGR